MKIKEVLLFITLLIFLVGVVNAGEVSENITSNDATEVVGELSTASDDDGYQISQIDVKKNEKTDDSSNMGKSASNNIEKIDTGNVKSEERIR